MSSKRGSWAKAERADKHIDELYDLVTTFRDKDPYQVVGEDDPVTGQRVGRFQERFPTPIEEISLIVGDAIHNLRSALDLLYGELVIANGKTISDSDTFPIRRDSHKFKASFPEIEKRIGTTAAATLKGLKPYQGGEDGFWRLHQLDIVDKHRLLLTTVAAVHGITQMVPMEWPKDAPVQVVGVEVNITPANIMPVKDGDELFRLDEKPQNDIKFRFEISIYEPPIAECEPVADILALFSGGVRHTIETFEAAGHLPSAS